MAEIVSKEDFLVHDQGGSIWNGRTIKTRLWFEVLEGEDQGKRVSIPLHRSCYSDTIQDKLLELKEGDVVEASLRRESKDGRWKPTEIEKLYNTKH